MIPNNATIEEKLAYVEAWNRDYPSGTSVLVDRMNEPTPARGKTRSEAWMLGASSQDPGHTPVVLLEDVTGAIPLSRVRPLRPRAES